MSADRNLLFGILALQMDFIRRDDLITGMNAWVLAKARPLGEILVEQGALAEDARALLEPLVSKHMERHGNDAEKSLASVSSVGSVREELAMIADPDVQASLAVVAASAWAGQESPCSQTTTVGAATSAGDRFRILRPHDKGALGKVSVAHDRELHREVALKEIQEHHADNLQSRSRLLLEAQITGGLEHPGVVPVYGLGTYPDGRPFYAMRFIRGDSLKKAIEAFHKADVPGRAPGERTLALRGQLGRFVAVCNAVAYAHSRGVLHRDLKPGNVMLGPYGETLVVDWGLAKVVGKRGEPGALATGAEEPTLRPIFEGDSAPTELGKAMGTPAYMSPEQAAGRLDVLGPASDVYSLGATLYCLLTGRAPFASDDIGPVLQRVTRGEFSPPRQVKRSVPAALEAICLKAMALRPDDRYTTARALADDIEHWLGDEPVTAYREPLQIRAGRWCRRHRALVTGGAASFLVLLIGGGVFAWWYEGEQARQALEKVERERVERDLDAAKELGENARRVNEWTGHRAQLTQINDWLTDSSGIPPEASKNRVRLNPVDRDRLRRAMLKEVLSAVEKSQPIPLDPQLGIALLQEIAVHLIVARTYADLGRPVAGIPHLERTISVAKYLGSPASGYSAKALMPRIIAMFRVVLLDLRERAGFVDLMEKEITETEQLLTGSDEWIKRLKQALAGIRGALLSRRGNFATAERLLLERHASLTKADDNALEILQGERAATVNRLVNLYTAWGRPADAAKWASQPHRDGAARPPAADR